jgi:hypothetical protein
LWTLCMRAIASRAESRAEWRRNEVAAAVA